MNIRSLITKRSVSTALGLAVLLSINTSAKAILLAYEGFCYTADTQLTNASYHAMDTGNNDGSFGWQTQWRNQSGDVGQATNRAGSYTYTDSFANTLNTSGGHLDVGRGNSGPVPSGNAQLVRNLGFGTYLPNGAGTTFTNTGMTAGTFYVSFLTRLLSQPNVAGIGAGAQYTRKAAIHFFGGSTSNNAGNGSQRFSFGVPNISDWSQAANTNGATAQWDVFSGIDGGSPNYPDRDADISTVAVEDVSLVVMRFDLTGDGGMDTVYTWINPANLLVENSTASALSTVTNSLDVINNIRLHANGGNAQGTNANIGFDEIRIGTTWADVLPVPEPSIIALGGVALSGLWLSIRRRRQS